MGENWRGIQDIDPGVLTRERILEFLDKVDPKAILALVPHGTPKQVAKISRAMRRRPAGTQDARLRRHGRAQVRRASPRTRCARPRTNCCTRGGRLSMTGANADDPLRRARAAPKRKPAFPTAATDLSRPLRPGGRQIRGPHGRDGQRAAANIALAADRPAAVLRGSSAIRLADEVIDRPMFATGEPRSGTTLMHALLSVDPDARALRFWEVMYPSPPPGLAGPDDPRRARRRRLARDQREDAEVAAQPPLQRHARRRPARGRAHLGLRLPGDDADRLVARADGRSSAACRPTRPRSTASTR